MTGKLYLIPTPLGEGNPRDVLPQALFDVLPGISNYVVEETRTARRFLSSAGLKGHIEELSFTELNEHTRPEEVEGMLALFEKCDVGLLSEAGLPAVADPGARLVALCHRHGIEVVPLSGPSSLMMALMSSGLNGQCFRFHGYLPAKNSERAAALRRIERESAAAGESEIFIETPYRNDAMLADILANCRPETQLCIAVNITMPDAFIRTAGIAQWRKNTPQIGKRPCVFIILAK